MRRKIQLREQGQMTSMEGKSTQPHRAQAAYLRQSGEKYGPTIGLFKSYVHNHFIPAYIK
jgi:hypothetical protein